jgi:hypothetical protein
MVGPFQPIQEDYNVPKIQKSEELKQNEMQDTQTIN